MDSQINQYELQRLLDGSLPESERMAFLQSVDERPVQWRTVALAFVEEQVLRSELRALVSAGDAGQVIGSALPPHAKAEEPQRSRRAVWQWAAAALLLVAGILAGTALPLSWFRPMAESEGPTAPIDVEQDRNYYVVIPSVANDSDTESDAPGVVDNVATTIFDERSRNVFRQHGYDVSEEPFILMVQDEQGGQYLIPQRRVSLVAHQDKK